MDNNSGVNTLLLVVILLIIVGGLVWFFGGGLNDDSETGLDVGVSLPTEESAE